MLLKFLLSLYDLWQMRIWGLCKLPDGRDWLSRKLGLALVGRAMLNKCLTQFSAAGWACAPSVLVIWPEEAQSLSLQSLWYDYRFYGMMMVTSPKKIDANIPGSTPVPTLGHCWPCNFGFLMGKKNQHTSFYSTNLTDKKYLQGSSSYKILQALITHWSG